MTVILGLIIICLGLYFLSLFFQLARLEKTMSEHVGLLEKYMIATYSLGDNSEDKDKEAAPEEAGAAKPQKTA